MATRKALEPTTNPTSKEVFNLHEDSETLKGQLERFLKIPGIELDRVQALIDAMPLMTDVDRTDSDLLRHIASLVGVQINFDIPIPRQREEIKRAVEVYKVKGTTRGIIQQARSISGLEVQVAEWSNNILVSNRADRRSSVISDPAIAALTGLPGDQNCYSLDPSGGSLISPEKFGIYFYLTEEDELLQAVVEKLERVLIDFWPATTEGKKIIVTPSLGDSMDLQSAVIESHFDEDEVAALETVYDRNWMISNDTSGSSNSRDWLSAHVLASEEWYDEYAA